MLPKKYRLPVQSVLSKRGSIKRTPHLTLSIYQNTLPHGRVGVVIAKKKAPTATKRNKLKRIIYSFFEKNPTKIRKGTDCVISLRELPRDSEKDAIVDILYKELHTL